MGERQGSKYIVYIYRSTKIQNLLIKTEKHLNDSEPGGSGWALCNHTVSL